MHQSIKLEDFLKKFDDEKEAKDFLKEVIDTGFSIDNFDKSSIDRLSAFDAINLSKEVWPIYYLETFNFKGQYVQ